MVEFMIGDARRDITAGMRERMCGMLENITDGQPIIFIVPEQFEYETERAVYKLLKSRGMLTKSGGIRIATFTDLSCEILEKNGDMLPRADEIVKNIVMHKAVEECRGTLVSLAGIAERGGFCGRMIKTVSSLKGAGFTAKGLEECVGKMGNSPEYAEKNAILLNKLSDVTRLYASYDAGLEGYLDGSDITAPAVEILRREGNEMYADSVVFVDCFNDFTASQFKLLKLLLHRARSITFGFQARSDTESDVFKISGSYISKLTDEARSNGITTRFVEDDIPEKYAKASPLSELAAKVFSDERSALPAGDSIELITAPTVYDEADFVCSKIISLIENKGMRYRDIAVLCTDISTGGRYIEDAFRKYGIPLFADTREVIASQPLVNCVMCVLNAAKGYSADTVLSCVKSGFFSMLGENGERVGISDYDADAFEGYIFEWALDTPHLRREFTCGGDTPERRAAENIRVSVAEPLYKLSRDLRSAKDGAAMTELLYDFLINTVGMKRAVFSASVGIDLGDTGAVPARTPLDPEKVSLCQRLWDEIVKILNALHRELSDVKISVEDYRDLFRDICSEATLANPPQTVDSVLVGDIDRTRADNIKAVFIVGASYSAFPTPEPQTGIFSQYETELISGRISEIRELDDMFTLRSSEEQYRLSLYRAYRALTLPTEYLCVSVSLVSPSGEETAKSTVMDELRGMFPDLEIKRAGDFPDAFFCRSAASAKLRFALKMNSPTRESAVLRSALGEVGCGEFVETLDEIRSRRGSDSKAIPALHRIKPETAELLFPTYVGATSIERLAVCRFGYFCREGLKIRPRTRREFNSVQRGNVTHALLEYALRDAAASGGEFGKMPRSALKALVSRHVGECLSELTKSNFTNDARGEFLFGNLVNSAVDTLMSAQYSFFLQKYRPTFFEVNIQSELSGFSGGFTDSQPPYPDPDLTRRSADDELLQKLLGNGETNAFSLNCKPLTIDLGNGRICSISGVIDRVDTYSDGKKLYVRTVDYKSSPRTFDIFHALGGVNIQTLIYLEAIMRANRAGAAELSVLPGGVAYISTKSSGASEEGLPAFTLLTNAHHESGLVVLDSNTKADYNKYARRVREQLENDRAGRLAAEKAEKYLTLDENNAVSAQLYPKLCEDVIDGIRGRVGLLLDGDVTARPVVYDEKSQSSDGDPKTNTKNPCKYCDYKEICMAREPVFLEKERKNSSVSYLTDDDKAALDKINSGDFDAPENPTPEAQNNDYSDNFDLKNYEDKEVK